MSRTVATMLYCGQGMMTLVEIYADDNKTDKADYLALIDCGGSADKAANALLHVADKVSARGHLDLVVISHQDRDHVGLLAALGPKVAGSMGPRPAKGLPRGTIYYGGCDWSDTNTDTLSGFTTKVGAGVPVQFQRKESSYGKSLKSLGGFGGVHVRLLISNLGATSEKKNSTSAVVVVDAGSYRVVLPGDATYETMKEVNAMGTTVLSLVRPVALLSLPHHGSITTAQEGSRLDILKTFAQTSMRPQHIGASAGWHNRYSHPSGEVIDTFTTVTDQAGAHTYVAFRDGTVPGSRKRKRVDGDWETEPTSSGIWSTVASAPQDSALATKLRKTGSGAVSPSAYRNIVIRINSGPQPGFQVGYGDLFHPTSLSGVTDAVLYAPAP